MGSDLITSGILVFQELADESYESIICRNDELSWLFTNIVSATRCMNVGRFGVKFIYSEKATKFCEIFPLLLTVCIVVKSKGKILQNFVTFSEYMNFTPNLPTFMYLAALVLTF